MRQVQKIALAVAMTLIAAAPCAAQNPFHFASDPNNTNVLAVSTCYRYFDPGLYNYVSDQANSGQQTDTAACDPSVSNGYVTDSADGSTSVIGWGTTRMSWSGEGILGCAETTTVSNYAGCAMGYDPDSYDPPSTGGDMRAYSIIASDTQPNGTACTLSGSLAMDWSFSAGQYDVLVARSGNLSVAVNGATVASFQLTSNMVSWSNQNGSSYVYIDQNSGGQTVTFSVTAHVGDHVAIYASSLNAIADDSITSAHDSQTFTINVDVGS